MNQKEKFKKLMLEILASEENPKSMLKVKIIQSSQRCKID